MNMRRYAECIVLLPLMFLLLVAGINRVMDPYQIFSADRTAHYSHKPALHANLRLHKAFQVRLQKPDALILGSSKAIQGIPTQHRFFEGTRVYNLAMPLASMKEIALLLDHANAIEPIRTVVLALDFLSFNALARADGPAAGFKPERLSGHENSPMWPVEDYLSALISLDALQASVDTWKIHQSGVALYPEQRVARHRVINGLGGRDDKEIRSRLNDGGHRSNTLKIEEFFTSAVYLPAPQRQFRFSDGGQGSLYWFEQLLRTLHQHDISAHLVISPSHARLNELIDAAGLWPQFEQWKREMVLVNQQVASEYTVAPYPLWDFSTPGDITTEPFPEAGDSDFEMRYFYESIHFNQHTGSRVLDHLLQSQSGNVQHAEPAPFGRWLTPKNIDSVLEDIRTKQRQFRLRFPAYRAELEQMINIHSSQ